MMNIAGLLFLFLVVLAGLMVGFTWLSHRWLGFMIGRKHRALESIHQTSELPAYWTEKHDRKLQELALAGADAALMSQWERRKRERIVIGLNRLIVYTTRTRLIAEEEVRQQILRQLLALRHEWELKPPNGGKSQIGSKAVATYTSKSKSIKQLFAINTKFVNKS